MLKGSFVHKIREVKKIAYCDSRRRFASFALSLGLLFTGSSGAISVQAEVRNKRREAHKRRSEKEREAHKRRLEKERDTRKRGRGNGLSSSRARAESEREIETRNRAFETERDGRTRHSEWRHDDRLPKDAKQSLFLQRPETFKRNREWIKEARKLR